MKESIQRLEKIAELNEDNFRYKMEIVSVAGKLRFEFLCFESAEGHSFVGGVGDSPEWAIQNAMKDIEGALESWGYTE